jgi:hypothetical protein
VLVQPATVDRWHREGFRRCWRRRARRPGRPRIDVPCRDLIRRSAAENHLWGAPRIHGELLKLGIAVSKRTVSRYLPDRLTPPSQTWRTCLTNHLGDLAFVLPMTSSYEPGDDDADVLGSSFRPALLSRDARCASGQWAKALYHARSIHQRARTGRPRARRRRSLGTSQGRARGRLRLWTHPIGGEVPVTVNGDVLGSEANRSGTAPVDLALNRKLQFQKKGWCA